MLSKTGALARRLGHRITFHPSHFVKLASLDEATIERSIGDLEIHSEIFDLMGQGLIGAFFLGGGQLDGQGNINLVGAGPYPKSDVRWPGSFGSAYVYYMVPRVILFREEHTRRVMVPKVDFISARRSSASLMMSISLSRRRIASPPIPASNES